MKPKQETAELTPADLIEVLGALAFAFSKSLPDVQRTDFANRLHALARFAEKQGKPSVMGGIQQVAAAVTNTPP